MANTGNGDLNFVSKLWQTADKMRNNMDAAEYKHVVLGLIFLKYISDAFDEIYATLKKDSKKFLVPLYSTFINNKEWSTLNICYTKKVCLLQMCPHC